MTNEIHKTNEYFQQYSCFIIISNYSKLILHI